MHAEEKKPVVAPLITPSPAVRPLLDRVYRALPFGFAKRAKEFFFQLTGPLFSHTAPYRRWRAEMSMRGSAQPRRALAASPATGKRDASAPALRLPASEAWAADGRREWADYATVRASIDAELQRVRSAKPPRRLPLIDLERSPPLVAAARFGLPAPSAAPRVSIIVPAYNHVTATLECLASIAVFSAGGPDFEVIVADDASTDETAEALALVANLRVVRQPANLGFLRNCNAAAMHARGEYLVLLNNDVQVTAGWLAELLAEIEDDSSVGAVGPRIVYPSGWLQEAGSALRRDGSATMVGLNDLPDRPAYAYSRDVDYVSGACLLLRRAEFLAMGGFDEHYAPAYCEDSDLCLRLRAQGKRIVYCANSTVLHHLSMTSDALPSDYKLACLAGNLERLSQRWRNELEALDQVRTIAFYLPQFHPIPENDRWWGRGFTEWSNVGRARPNFVGHYQPRVPADLGYYDLRLAEVMEQQAELARRYGVGGFCYYYYWFAGKRLLEAPIERMLETGRPDFPFCLCWANENWSRRWDGQETDVLMRQAHSDEDDANVIADLMRYFRSPNYIRIGGRPLVLVYRVLLFPDFARTAATWRRLCRDAGLGEIYIAMVESFELVTAGVEPQSLGCDAAVEFPPQGLADPRPPAGAILNPEFQGAVADYRELAVRYATRPLPAYKRFPGVMPGWDNTARRQNHGYCFEHATPGAFQAWLETAVERSREQYSGDEKLVFINAWNEWAEGAYLEPDRRFGHAFLEAHANALDAGHLLAHRRHALG